MHMTSSCSTTCCVNICQRPSYGEERRNISMARSTLGPFPDEWLLSGLDKILYICGIKNMCDLVDKFPLSSDIYLSSSTSQSDSGLTSSCRTLLEECNKRTVRDVCKEGDTETENNVERLQLNENGKSLKTIVKTTPDDIKTHTEQPKQLASDVTKIRDVIASNHVLNISAKKNLPIEVVSEKNSHSQPILLGEKCDKEADPFSGSSKLEQSSLPSKKMFKPTRFSRATVNNARLKKIVRLQNGKLPSIVGTKWAMARINIFSDCSRTYEILEIKGRLPQAVIPCKTVVFFAVLPDGSTICYDYVKVTKRC